MTALVLDAHLKGSLACIRSLGRQGVPIIAGSDRRAAMGLYSRYVASKFVYPSPLADRRGFVEAVTRQAEGAGNIAIFAFGDSTLLPLADHVAGCVLPANREDFEIAFDKARTLKLAQEMGIEIPLTHLVRSKSEMIAISSEMTYPAVLKPRRSVNWNGDSGIQNSTLYAFSPEDLQQKCVSILLRTEEFPLLQEYLRGEETGVEFLCDDGRVVAACAHRRIRCMPPAGGSGVLKETISLSYNGLGDRAMRLVAALGWSGPIMVEFKTDVASGVPKLMEINGRFWGSLPLAVAAGADFPYLYYRMARGETLPSDSHYREGLCSRHFLGDLRNLLWVLFEKDPLRPLALPSRRRAIRDFLVTPSSCRSDVMDWRDPKPAVMEIADAMARNLPLAHVHAPFSPARTVYTRC